MDRIPPETRKKALELACSDAADEQCPHEYDLYTCEKCSKCPHDGELRTDAKRDAQCWYDYYIQQAEMNECDDLNRALSGFKAALLETWPFKTVCAAAIWILNRLEKILERKT